MRAWLLALCAVAQAQAAGPGVTVYPADFFEASAPVTAADMVARLPGFTLVDADDEVRGYAAAQGNVLIDGARPASKRESLDDVLERIPAHAVERIEVIRAGAAGYDLLGQAMIANVVRKTQAGIEGAIETGVLADADGGWEPSLQAEAAREWAGRALDVSFGSVPELDEDSGDGRRLDFEPDGTLDEDEAMRTRHVQRAWHASAGLRQALAIGDAGVFAALRDTRDREEALIGAETSEESETVQEAEFALRHSRPLDARTTLEALASRRSARSQVRSQEREDEEVQTFRQDTHAGEGILRVDLRQARSPRLTLNAGVEAALNTLDGDAVLVEDGEAVDLPGSRVRIDEGRGEATFGAQWRASDAWRFEAGLGVERSRLRQRGDSPLQRDFTYWKPSLAVRQERGEREHWRLSLARDVGQLDFEDFVAGASLDNDVVSAGNARLQPAQAWRLAIDWERRFGRDGAIALTLAHEAIDDVVDRVPVTLGGEVFDAPGNLGDGARDSLALEFGSTLGAFGWPTLRVDATLLLQRSRVTDPVTGGSRGISGESPVEGEVSLTQSLPARGLEWGMEVELAEREHEFRFDETAVERVGASLELFVERAFREHWRLRAELVDPFGRRIEETRRGEVGRELRRHDMPAQLWLTLRRGTGG